MHPREITDRIYEVWKLNAQIIKEKQKIPGLFPLIQTCLLQQIEMSNELEAIHSSRRELASLIETEQSHPITRRFAGQVRQYQALMEKRTPFPKDSRAVRMIYDLLLLDDIRTVCPESLPDGKYFRKSEVFITNGLKTIHQNGLPENEIIRLMNETLLILSNEHPLISAALFHFIFEWLHPFYDGNGRTGRFLCVLKMAEDLELAGILHFSFTLQTRRKKYYRLFSDAESFWNRGDLTPFVIEFLELLIESMQEGLNMLQEKAALYLSALQRTDALSLSFSHSVFLKTMLELSFPSKDSVPKRSVAA